MTTSSRWLTLMAALALGAALPGCQQQEGQTDGSAKTSSAPMMKEGARTAPADSSAAMTGGRSGGMASTPGATTGIATPAPVPGEKADSQALTSSGKPAGEGEGDAKQKGS